MSISKASSKSRKTSPSIFALLVDEINQMTEVEQKSLWMQINNDKISSLAKAIDATTVPHNMSPADIDNLISEAKQYARSKKKS